MDVDEVSNGSPQYPKEGRSSRQQGHTPKSVDLQTDSSSEDESESEDSSSDLASDVTLMASAVELAMDLSGMAG